MCNKPTKTYTKEQAYDLGFWNCAPPPVCTAQWARRDWIEYVTFTVAIKQQDTNTTLAQALDAKFKERIDEFHFYIKEVGLEKAKEIILKSTCIHAVIRYVKLYH